MTGRDRSQIQGIAGWLAGPLRVATRSAEYLREHPKHEVYRGYVQRVLDEVVREARTREDAETCARAMQLGWILADGVSSPGQLDQLIVGLQHLKPVGINGE
ncbi:MAG: hypothetical protein JSW71_19405 [Gemmatimonadota bacterium]|nr:MAG: hypothetical protein JSW71_19405 [Gemmatimonadota bacterium]